VFSLRRDGHPALAAQSNHTSTALQRLRALPAAAQQDASRRPHRGRGRAERGRHGVRAGRAVVLSLPYAEDERVAAQQDGRETLQCVRGLRALARMRSAAGAAPEQNQAQVQAREITALLEHMVSFSCLYIYLLCVRYHPAPSASVLYFVQASRLYIYLAQDVEVSRT
jgi:hypothetical protein